MTKAKAVRVEVLQSFVAVLADNVYYGVPGQELVLPAREANKYQLIGWVKIVAPKPAVKVTPKPRAERPEATKVS